MILNNYIHENEILHFFEGKFLISTPVRTIEKTF